MAGRAAGVLKPERHAHREQAEHEQAAERCGSRAAQLGSAVSSPYAQCHVHHQLVHPVAPNAPMFLSRSIELERAVSTHPGRRAQSRGLTPRPRAVGPAAAPAHTAHRQPKQF